MTSYLVVIFKSKLFTSKSDGCIFFTSKPFSCYNVVVKTGEPVSFPVFTVQKNIKNIKKIRIVFDKTLKKICFQKLFFRYFFKGETK